MCDGVSGRGAYDGGEGEGVSAWRWDDVGEDRDDDCGKKTMGQFLHAYISGGAEGRGFVKGHM